MSAKDKADPETRLELPQGVTLLPGAGSLPKVHVSTPAGEAEVYLHGAHVTHFQKAGDAPLLFLSKLSRFAPDQPIRGGIPFIFPWFGAKANQPMHGFARLADWELKACRVTPENAVELRFAMPGNTPADFSPPFALTYTITIRETLALEATVENRSTQTPLPFELCLHTYFAVADISSVRVAGLQKTDYLDKVDAFTRKTERSNDIDISSEMDRVYLDAAGPVAILDPGNNRTIRVDKRGSNSTVVWNPWMTKARQMADFGDDDYLKMICVESGNVGPNALTLQPGQSASMGVELSSVPGSG